MPIVEQCGCLEDDRVERGVGMKKIIKRIGVIAMAFMVAANMAACIGLDQIQARQVEQALEARYGEEFKVTRIGNRLGSGEPDTAEAYCHPVANPDIVFRARIDIDGNLLNDPYPSAVLKYQMEEYLMQSFEADGMEVQINGYFDMSNAVGDYKEIDVWAEDAVAQSVQYGLCYCMDIAMKDTGNNEEMAKAIYHSAESVLDIDEDIRVFMAVYIIESDRYEECKELARQYDGLSIQEYYDTGAIRDVVESVNDDYKDREVVGVEKTAEDILQEWEAE